MSDRGIRHFAFARGEPQEAALGALADDGVARAHALPVPTLLVHGDRDPEVPNAEIHRLLSALPDGELVQVPGAGHMLPLTAPDVVVAEVTRWVTQVSAARDAAA